MNLPEKKFKIGDVIIYREHIYAKYIVLGHKFMTKMPYKIIDENELEPDKAYIGGCWVVFICNINSHKIHDNPYPEQYFKLDIEETRNYKINNLLNINE